MITRKQALQIIANIENCDGYRETNGEDWLGPRLHELRCFIDGLPMGVVSTPEPTPEDVNAAIQRINARQQKRNVYTNVTASDVRREIRRVR